MFAIARDVTDLTKCDVDVDDPAPYRILQEEYATIEQRPNHATTNRERLKTERAKTRHLMASPRFTYGDVRLSRPRRPYYLVFSLNKLNAVESWMRTLRVTAAEGFVIFDNNVKTCRPINSSK